MIFSWIKNIIKGIFKVNRRIGRPLQLLSFLFSKPIRYIYHREKTLKHDSEFDFRSGFLTIASEIVLRPAPETFKIYNDEISFSSAGSLMSVQGYYVGEIEYHLLCYLKTVIRDDFIMMDVGAHHGLFSCVSAFELDNKGFGGQIHAFEPDERNRKYLEKNINQNDLSNYVVINSEGVSKEGGTSSFYVNEFENSDNKIEDSGAENSQKKYVEIETTSIDQYMTRESVNHLDLIKIDTQGTELQILEGAADSIKLFKPAIIVEVVQKTADVRGMKNLLAEYGYSIFGVTKSGELCGLNSPDSFVSWDWVAIHNQKLDV